MTGNTLSGRLTTVVETAYGAVRGSDDGQVKAWKGIRYAAPPVGALRWRAPEPPAAMDARG
jgi:para-nitrobenzyl esterase